MSSTFKCSLILDKLLEADGVVLAWLTRAHCWHWWHWRCSEWRSSPGPGVTTQAAWSPIRDEHGAPPATLTTSQQSREEPGAELAQNITSALWRALHCNVHNCLTLRANSAPALSFISFWLIKAYNGLAQWQWLISLTNTLPGAPAAGLACDNLSVLTDTLSCFQPDFSIDWFNFKASIHEAEDLTSLMRKSAGRSERVLGQDNHATSSGETNDVARVTISTIYIRSCWGCLVSSYDLYHNNKD